MSGVRTIKRAAKVATVLLGAATSAWAQGVRVDLKQGERSVDYVAVPERGLERRPSAAIRGSDESPSGTFQIDETFFEGSLLFRLKGLGGRPSTLKLNRLTLPNRLPAGDFSWGNLPFEGPLTQGGVTRMVRGVARVSREGSHLLLQARFGFQHEGYDVLVQLESSAPFTRIQ